MQSCDSLTPPPPLPHTSRLPMTCSTVQEGKQACLCVCRQVQLTSSPCRVEALACSCSLSGDDLLGERMPFKCGDPGKISTIFHFRENRAFLSRYQPSGQLNCSANSRAGCRLLCVCLRVRTCFPEEPRLLHKYFGRSQNTRLVVGQRIHVVHVRRCLWLTRGGLSAAGALSKLFGFEFATAAASTTPGGGGRRRRGAPLES